VTARPEAAHTTLYAIIAFKLIRGLLLLYLAIGGYRLVGEELRPHFDGAVRWLRLDPETDFFNRSAISVDAIKRRAVRLVRTERCSNGLLSSRGDRSHPALPRRGLARPHRSPRSSCRSKTLLALRNSPGRRRHPGPESRDVAYLYRNRERSSALVRRRGDGGVVPPRPGAPPGNARPEAKRIERAEIRTVQMGSPQKRGSSEHCAQSVWRGVRPLLFSGATMNFMISSRYRGRGGDEAFRGQAPPLAPWVNPDSVTPKDGFPGRIP